MQQGVSQVGKGIAGSAFVKQELYYAGLRDVCFYVCHIVGFRNMRLAGVGVNAAVGIEQQSLLAFDGDKE